MVVKKVNVRIDVGKENKLHTTSYVEELIDRNSSLLSRED